MVDARDFSATKIWIAQLLNGQYVKEVEEEKQNHVLLIDGRKIYRANLIATVVGIDDEDKSIFIDDGTGRIKIKSFDENYSSKGLLLGDFVLVIGKIREFGEKYILQEIVKKIIDKKWIEVRKKELGEIKKEQKTEEITQNSSEINKTQEETVEHSKENKTETILSIIRNLDEGDGADLDQVLLALSTTASEMDIERLLNEGEIFQTKPGKIKVLD